MILAENNNYLFINKQKYNEIKENLIDIKIEDIYKNLIRLDNQGFYMNHGNKYFSPTILICSGICNITGKKYLFSHKYISI